MTARDRQAIRNTAISCIQVLRIVREHAQGEYVEVIDEAIKILSRINMGPLSRKKGKHHEKRT